MTLPSNQEPSSVPDLIDWIRDMIAKLEATPSCGAEAVYTAETEDGTSVERTAVFDESQLDWEEYGQVVQQAAMYAARLGGYDLFDEYPPGLTNRGTTIWQLHRVLGWCESRSSADEYEITLDQPTYTPPELAELWKRSKNTIIRWINNGELKATNLAEQGKQPRWLISNEHAREFYERRLNHQVTKRSPKLPNKPWGDFDQIV